MSRPIDHTVDIDDDVPSARPAGRANEPTIDELPPGSEHSAEGSVDSVGPSEQTADMRRDRPTPAPAPGFRPLEQTLDVDDSHSSTSAHSSARPSSSAQQSGSDARTVPLDASASASPWLMSAINSRIELPVVDRAHYRVISEHARGGLGRILKARDQRTGRIVAVKELLTTTRRDSMTRRFAREALITANLQHPAIIPVYEVGRWNTGELFYAMKFVLGRSFRDVIRGCKSFDERLARLPIVVSVAEALAYAHARRIIHRDLKPANVLVGDLGETVVIDWGLAKPLGEQDELEPDPIVVPDSLAPDRTVAGAVMGTPSYMPPEQARGEPTDERADVYQIGALLYHLIAGVPPYHGRTPASSRELVDVVAKETPPSLVSREPGTPPDLATIVAKAMARRPADRYANAGQLTDDLRRFTTGQLVGSHHYDRRTLFTRWLRRNRAPVTVGGVLAIVLAGFAVWSISRIVSERDMERRQRARAEHQTTRAEQELAIALYEKGRNAEANEEWARAAMYYATARRHHDTPELEWAAGLAEARAVVPQSHHEGHKAWVRASAISSDGERVVTVDDAGELRMWSPRDGHLFAARAISTHALYAVAISPDGSEIATAGDEGDITLLTSDLRTTKVLKGHAGRVWTLTYSPDGALLASGGEDKTIRLWPVAGGAPRVLLGHTQRVYSITFSPDGTQLASGSDDRRLWVWNVATGRGRERGDHKAGGIRAVAYTPTGDAILTTGWDHEIRLWKGERGEPEVWNDADIVEGAIVAPSGDVLVTAGQFESIHAWEISTHRMITLLEGTGPSSTVAFSRDGHWLITAGKSGPIAWDATAFRRLATIGHRAEMAGLAFSRDGRQFVSGAADHTLRLWDVATAKELRRVATGTNNCSDGALVLDDGDIASTCDDATIRRWDAAGNRQDLATKSWMRVTALSPDGATLAAGHEAGLLTLVDVPHWTIKLEKTLHAHNIYGVQFARDGRLVTASLDDHVRVWHGPDLTLDVDVKTNTENGVLTAALSPDNALLVIGTQDGGAINVWEIAEKRWRLRDVGSGKLGIVWKLLYTPDGTRVVTASNDGLVRIWNASTWGPPDVLDAAEGSAVALAVSPDSMRAIAGYRSGAIVIWDLRTKTMERRIGGRAREHSTCSDLKTQAWTDEAHRAIVSNACAAPPLKYLKHLEDRTHQRLNNDVDVTWDWMH